MIIFIPLAVICNAQMFYGVIVEAVPEVSSNDCGGIGCNLLFRKLQLLENEFRAVNADMKNLIERTYKQILERLDKLETTITHRLERFENERINQEDFRCKKQPNRNKVSDVTQEIEKSISQLQQTVEINFSTMKSDLKLIKTLVPDKSCKHLVSSKSGKFWLRPFSNENTIEVYCEQEKFGGGWLVFQRRFDGSVDFFRNWTHYKNGFGTVDGEFWLGLELLHRLTSDRRFELIVELEANNSTVKFARYDDFAIGSEEEMFALKKLGSFFGTARDALDFHRGMKFSTMDRANGNCSYNYAKGCMSAWWYGCGYTSDLNQPYVLTKRNIIHWAGFSFKEGLKSTTMMIREI